MRQCQLDVSVLDISSAMLDEAATIIDKNLKRQVAKGTLEQPDKHQVLFRLAMSTDYACLQGVDIVIEATTETWRSSANC